MATDHVEFEMMQQCSLIFFFFFDILHLLNLLLSSLGKEEEMVFSQM